MSTDTGTIAADGIAQALLGRAPKPFRVGRRLELFMTNGRVVRGMITKAGKKASLMTIGVVPAGDHGPAYDRVNIIPYTLVNRWRVPVPNADDGTWMPGHPDYKAQLHASDANPVREVKR